MRFENQKLMRLQFQINEIVIYDNLILRDQITVRLIKNKMKDICFKKFKRPANLSKSIYLYKN